MLDKLVMQTLRDHWYFLTTTYMDTLFSFNYYISDKKQFIADDLTCVLSYCLVELNTPSNWTDTEGIFFFFFF